MMSSWKKTIKYFVMVLILTLVLVLQSCNNTTNKTNIKNNTYNLTITDEKITIPIDNRTYSESICSFLYESKIGIRFLAYRNKNSNEIHFYDIDSMKLSHKVKVDIVGPNGTGSKMYGFWVKDIDTIYINPKQQKRIFVINHRGEIINKIDYEKYKPENTNKETINKTAPFFSVPEHPLIIHNNHFIISVGPAFYKLCSKEKYSQIPISYCLDTVNQTIKPLTIYYPESTYKYNNYYFSAINGNDWFIYSFETDNNIFVTKDFKNIYKHNAKSRYIKSIKKNEPDSPFSEYFAQIAINPNYLKIMYDPYRKVYYRLAYPGIKLNKDSNVRELYYYKQVFSIIILDEEFKIIGETLLPKNKFYYRDMFIAKEGLYISENHIKNPSYNPDQLSFRLLKLTKDEE